MVLLWLFDYNYNYVARALDLSAAGIMVPMVNTADDATKIVRSSKYPPQGKRGAGFGFAHDNYINQSPLSYIEKANNSLINIIQIETKSALQNVKEIASINGVGLSLGWTF